MGHDISAYIKTKSTPKDDSFYASENEVAYFRIGAFNTTRQRLFYGTLRGSDVANGGVSGNGSCLEFTRGDIENAISACKYYLDDTSSLQDTILDNPIGDESTKEMFISMFQELLPNSGSIVDESKPTTEEIREHIADVWKFHEDILSEYDFIRSTDDSAQIQIYFG